MKKYLFIQLIISLISLTQLWAQNNNLQLASTNSQFVSVKEFNSLLSDTPMSERVYSLIGTAFYAGNGVTIPYWDYDIDFTYSGSSGNEFYYTLNRQEILQNGEFKVRENHAWTEPSFGFNDLTIISPDNFGWVGANIKALSRKVYDITFIVDSLNNSYKLSLQYSEPYRPKAIINKAATAPVIDGNIDAIWSGANAYNIDQAVVGTTPTLGASGTTTWKGLWTDNGIYILLQVNDNVFSPAYSGANPPLVWEYDKPEIYFDVNTLLEDGKGPGSPDNTGLGHHQIAPDFTAINLNGTPETLWDGQTIYAFKVTNPSYVAEYYIPFTKLIDKNAVQVSKTATIGFDATIVDRDGEAGFRQRAVWSNYGRNNESWLNMDDCGTFILVGPGANVLVNSINVTGAGNATTITTEAGTLQMNASVLPADATNKNVVWTVSNGTGKASISSTGLLTAKEDGTVTVIATSTDGSNISSSKTITISNQYISYADGSLIKNGGFETDGPIGGFWGVYAVPGNSASVVNGVLTMTTTSTINVWDMSVNQVGWVAYNDSSYNLSFTAWSDVNRTFTIDFEDNNNNYNRFGASTDPEAIYGRSEWLVSVTPVPKVYTFHVTMDQILVTTNFMLNILAANATGTIYIDNISLVSVGYKPLGNGPALPGTASTTKTICSGTSTGLSLEGYAGTIQWQSSGTGTSDWVNVSGGTGATTADYTTANLSSKTYFRAAVSKPDFPTVYSNTVTINITPLPGNAGTISGTSAVCADQNKTVTYQVPAISSASSYIWTLPSGVSGSSSTRTISANFGNSSVSGIVSVKGHNSCGDGLASSKNVIVSEPYSGEKICIVTIDLETGKNLVVWEKTHNVGIASYNVYREKLDQTGVYEVIGTVDFNDITQFVDMTSFPRNRQYLYKISAVDTCGNESALSKYHKPVFLQFGGTTTGVNLNWEKYEIEDGIPDISGYAIFKGSDSTKLSSFTTVATSIKVYFDIDPLALIKKTYYRIGGVLTHPCDPAEISGKKASSGPYVHSLSNLEDNRLQSTGIEDDIAFYGNFNIYPSPFTDKSTIYYSLNAPTHLNIEVFNVVGEKISVLLNENQSPGIHQLEMTSSDFKYTSGLYFVRIVADEKVLVKKVILE